MPRSHGDEKEENFPEILRPFFSRYRLRSRRCHRSRFRRFSLSNAPDGAGNEVGRKYTASLRIALVQEWLADHQLSEEWPSTPTGAPSLDDDTLKEMGRRYPEIRQLREVRQLQALMVRMRNSGNRSMTNSGGSQFKAKKQFISAVAKYATPYSEPSVQVLKSSRGCLASER